MVGKLPKKIEAPTTSKAHAGQSNQPAQVAVPNPLRLDIPQVPPLVADPWIKVHDTLPSPAISSSAVPDPSINVEIARIVAAPALEDFWISSVSGLLEAGAPGMKMFKGRQFVPLSDGHFVQVGMDADTGLLRAKRSTELNPSGPVLVADAEGAFWRAADSPPPIFQGVVHAEDNDHPLPSPSAENRIRALYPAFTGEEVATFLTERLHKDASGVLLRLEQELTTLRQELQAWSSDVQLQSGMNVESSVDALADQRRIRERFSRDLQALWQRRPLAELAMGEDDFSAFVDFKGELPAMSARFEYVIELALTARSPDVRLGRFLDSFPNVRYLILEKIRMDGFAPGIFQMRDLQHLILKNCSLRLSEFDAEGVARIETLTLLKLDGNPLGVAPQLGFMHQLKELSLVDTGLIDVPSGIEGLRYLRLLDLSANNIVEINEAFFEIPDTQALYVNLLDNPLSNAAQQRINEYLANFGLDSEVTIRIQQPIVDDIEQFTDSSDSGVVSESD